MTLQADPAPPNSTSPPEPNHPVPKHAIVATGITCGLIGLLWAGPGLWYSQSVPVSSSQPPLAPNPDGWAYAKGAISEAEERSLFADESETGTFRHSKGQTVRWFAARRKLSSPNEIGLFVHTPDRCWVESGWKLETSAPETRSLRWAGKEWNLERRLFRFGRQLELVYFGGLVNGLPPGFRLDHNLSTALRPQHSSGRSSAFVTRLSDGRMWGRVWETFLTRTPLESSKLFFRVSVPVKEGSIPEGDNLLQDFLVEWIGREAKFEDQPRFNLNPSPGNPG